MATISTMYLKKWLEDETLNYHLPILKQWATGLSHTTELGTGKIASTWGLLAAKPKKMVSIDWNHPLFAVPPESLEVVRQLAANAGIEFEFIAGDTTQIEIEPTDLLFIDTWPTYEQLLLELFLHSEQVKQYIVVHATNERHFPGMSCAIEDFIAFNPEWKIIDYQDDFPGVTVLRRVDDGPVSWGTFQADELRTEIARQHELYYKEYAAEGPTNQEWLDYRKQTEKHFNNTERWPKSHPQAQEIIIIAQGNSLTGAVFRGIEM